MKMSNVWYKSPQFEDLLEKRQAMHFEKDKLGWLDICIENFESLLKTPLRLSSSGKRSVQQPQWDMSRPPIPPEFKPDDPVDEIQVVDQTTSSFEILAWYSPLHFNGPSRYGAFLPSVGIVHLANDLQQMLGPDILERRETLRWAALVLRLHEFGHAFIERLVYTMEPVNGIAHYTLTQKKYDSFIGMEEAICNTFVCGMHKRALAAFPELSEKADKLHTVLIKFMRKQPRGYRDFLEVTEEPHQCRLFAENCTALLAIIYKIDAHSQLSGLVKMLHHFEAYTWIFGPAGIESSETDGSAWNAERIDRILFPWKTPVYFLDINAVDSIQDCFRVDSFPDEFKSPTCQPWQFVPVANGKRSVVINSCCHTFTSIEDLINELKKDAGSNHKIEADKNSKLIIKGDLILINNEITSLQNIHKFINSIDGIADFRGNPIMSRVLGSIGINKLGKLFLENKQVEEVLNKWLAGDRDILDCQEELITAGENEYAKL